MRLIILAALAFVFAGCASVPQNPLAGQPAVYEGYTPLYAMLEKTESGYRFTQTAEDINPRSATWVELHSLSVMNSDADSAALKGKKLEKALLKAENYSVDARLELLGLREKALVDWREAKKKAKDIHDSHLIEFELMDESGLHKGEKIDLTALVKKREPETKAPNAAFVGLDLSSGGAVVSAKQKLGKLKTSWAYEPGDIVEKCSMKAESQGYHLATDCDLFTTSEKDGKTVLTYNAKITGVNLTKIRPDFFEAKNADFALRVEGDTIKIENKLSEEVKLRAMTVYYEGAWVVITDLNIMVPPRQTVDGPSLYKYMNVLPHETRRNVTKEKLKNSSVLFGLAGAYETRTQVKSLINKAEFNELDMVKLPGRVDHGETAVAQTGVQK